MHGRLLLENLLESHPGVEEFSLERDLRGAILQVKAVVRDEHVKARLHEMLARTVGRNFADDRLAVYTSIADGAESRRVLLHEVDATLRDGEVMVEVTLSDLRTRNERRSKASRSGARRPGASLRLAAEATLGALSDLVHWNASVAVDQVDLLESGPPGSAGPSPTAEGAVVLVGLILQSSRAKTRLFGVSRAHSGAYETAAARAVLSALNRLID